MSKMNALYTVSPKDAPMILEKIFQAGLVPFLKSSPGRGKSAMFRAFADKWNLELVDIRLSMYEPQDFTGLPFDNGEKSKFKPFDLLPLEGDSLPKGKDGWLILLDEFTHAEPEMIRASYKLVLDRMAGQNRIHENALVALAGNSVDDNALANNTGTALNSRVTHLLLGSDPDYWTTQIAAPLGFDHRVIGFVSANKDCLNDFDPDQDEHSFCSERTWEFVSKLIKGEKDVSHLTPAIAGTISPGVATSFIQFCEVYKDLINIKDVIKDPEGCDLPSESVTRWALVTHLAKEANENNIDPIALYVDRLPIQYAMIFLQMIRSDGALMRAPNSRKLLNRLGKLL